MSDLNIPKNFTKSLSNWYLKNKRELPWRETTDPYKIWLSEIILQQTRVQQGMPYYLNFVTRYPDVQKLAQASEKDVLSLWQGLGYYSRGRNLHKTAGLIVKEHNGIFPGNYDGLLTLKGIGPYTAAAIASFAYKERVAVVDGNVYRVLARLFGMHEDITQNASKKVFAALAKQLIDAAKEPDIHNQAMMEFGALHCTPAKPSCGDCPFAAVCVACRSNEQHLLPVKSKKTKKQERFFQYFILQHGSSMLMKERKEKDIWHGLYEFLLLETDKAETIKTLLKILPELSLDNIVHESKAYKHVLSHQVLHARFFVVNISKRLFLTFQKKYGLLPVATAELADTPKPVLISNFLKAHNF